MKKIVFKIFCFLLCVHSAYAHAENLKIGFEELSRKAALVGVYIVDLRKTGSEEILSIDSDVLDNPGKIVKTLGALFLNTISRVDDSKSNTEYKVYLLPTTADVRAVVEEMESKSRVDFVDRIGGNGGLEKINALVRSIPEVKSLKQVYQEQKSSKQKYTRIVNPEDLNDYYSFTVSYSKLHDMFVPYRDAGGDLRGKMEGFSNFGTVFKFIESKASDWKAYRRGDDLYLKLEGSGVTIMLSGDENEMEAFVRSSSDNLLKFDNYIVGSASKFKSYGRFYLDDMDLNIVDDVSSY